MTPQEQVQGLNSKAGTYPFADRANLVGTFIYTYYTQSGDARAQAFEGLLALTYPKAAKDKQFMALYQKATKDEFIDVPEMNRLVMEMCRVWDELKLWDWKTDDIEELVVP